jgi:hypothetical protein
MCVVQVSDCTNFYTERSCPHDPSQSCMVWMAGTFIAPGSEVCHSYKYMPNDKAMLQYGFLQVGTFILYFSSLIYLF